jgi:Uma2 family endonuclease
LLHLRTFQTPSKIQTSSSVEFLKNVEVLSDDLEEKIGRAMFMTQAVVRGKFTFEEYIDRCAQSDERYELIRGELIQMTPPTWFHIRIACFLEQALNTEIKRLNYVWEAFRETGQRTGEDSSRLADVMVVPLEIIETVLNQTAVLMVPAVLVIEIVSPSSTTEDYTNKLKEYEAFGIVEYWLIGAT